MTETRARYGMEHARIGRKIINFNTGGYGVCAWSDCSNDACSLYEVRQHEHARTIPCDSSLASHVTYAFCREKCKMYWLACTGEMAKDTELRNRGHIMGMLPPGYKRSIL